MGKGPQTPAHSSSLLAPPHDGGGPPRGDDARRIAEKLDALSSVAATLSHARELDPLLKSILDLVLRLFETDFAHIMLFDPANETLRVKAVLGAPPEFIVGIDYMKPGEGIAGRVYQTGKPLVIQDASTDPLITRQAVRDLGVHAAACVPLIAHGKPIGVLLTATREPDYRLPEDIELLQAIGSQLGIAIENARLFEEGLRTRQLWESTFNAISDGISVHTLDLQVAKVNRALSRILGMAPEEVIGKRCCPMVLGRDDPLPDCADLRATGETPCQVTEIVERSGGQILRITVDPLLDESGRAYGSVHVVSDITEQVTLERQMARAEQLALIGELAAGLAHEVKNPLAGIKGAIEIVRDGLPDEHGHRVVLGHVLEEIMRVDRTIGNLLEYARPRPSSRTKVDLNVLVERVIATARMQTTSDDVHIEFRSAPHLPHVFIDPDEIQKVVLNLLINAIQAVKDHGRIVTETTFTSSPGGGSVVITVSDTGEGIQPENLDKIFRPFFTSKKRGTGLGLATCKRIVTSYGGTITVASEIGKGSRFTVVLPQRPKEINLTPRIIMAPPSA